MFVHVSAFCLIVDITVCKEQRENFQNIDKKKSYGTWSYKLDIYKINTEIT